MYMDVLPACVSMHRMSAVCRDKKRVSDTLGLELQMIVSRHEMLGMNLCPLEEQPVLLTAKPSLWHWKHTLFEK